MYESSDTDRVNDVYKTVMNGLMAHHNGEEVGNITLALIAATVEICCVNGVPKENLAKVFQDLLDGFEENKDQSWLEKRRRDHTN